MRRKLKARFIGVEPYFEDLQKGKLFYGERLGFPVLDEEPGHYAWYGTPSLPSFALNAKAANPILGGTRRSSSSREVPNLLEAVSSIGRDLIFEMKPGGGEKRRPWAVLHDPEGYNIVLVEAATAANPVIRSLQCARGLTESEVALPAPYLGRKIFDHLSGVHWCCLMEKDSRIR